METGADVSVGGKADMELYLRFTVLVTFTRQGNTKHGNSFIRLSDLQAILFRIGNEHAAAFMVRERFRFLEEPLVKGAFASSVGMAFTCRAVNDAREEW